MPSTLLPLLETRQLNFSFGKRPILHDVNLQVEPGSIYGFLGPNGAGKSTTMRLLLGLLRPATGSVHLFGHDMARHRVALLGRVGALIENPSLYDHLTGRERRRPLGGVGAASVEAAAKEDTTVSTSEDTRKSCLQPLLSTNTPMFGANSHLPDLNYSHWAEKRLPVGLGA